MKIITSFMSRRNIRNQEVTGCIFFINVKENYIQLEKKQLAVGKGIPECENKKNRKHDEWFVPEHEPFFHSDNTKYTFCSGWLLVFSCLLLLWNKF